MQYKISKDGKELRILTDTGQRQNFLLNMPLECKKKGGRRTSRMNISDTRLKSARYTQF